MAANSSSGAFGDVLQWLARHAGFPQGRLPRQAEALVCLAALAAAEESRETARHAIRPQDPAQTAALRTHALRRSRVHFKTDNSAKV